MTDLAGEILKKVVREGAKEEIERLEGDVEQLVNARKQDAITLRAVKDENAELDCLLDDYEGLEHMIEGFVAETLEALDEVETEMHRMLSGVVDCIRHDLGRNITEQIKVILVSHKELAKARKRNGK